MVAATNLYATIPSPAAEPITLPRKDLLAALAILCKATDRRSSLPILADVMLDWQDGCQRISATDLNCSVSYRPRANGAAVHGITVNAKLLHDMVKGATGDTVILSKSGTGLTVASNGADATMMGRAAADFPRLPLVPELSAVDGTTIGESLEACMHAICKDETRFHLNGILIESKGTMFRAVSTDGHRLIKVTRDCDAFVGTGILPAKAATIVAKLAKLDGTVRMGIAKMHLHVSVWTERGTWEASFRLVDAQFPPYDQVIPTGYERLATVERKPLIAAMKRAKALCTETRGAKISVASGKLTITSDHPDNGTTSESLAAEGEWLDTFGGVQAFGINAGYLVEALEEIDCKHVTLAFGAAREKDGAMLDPIEVRGTDDAVSYSVQESRQIEVIMPMRI